MHLNQLKQKISVVLQNYRDKVVFAYLFGSAVEGHLASMNDIDIAIYHTHGGKETQFETRLQLYGDLCRELKRNDIDVIILNTTRNLMLLDEIIRKGLVLFDRDASLREVFEYRILHLAIDFKNQRFANIGH